MGAPFSLPTKSRELTERRKEHVYSHTNIADVDLRSKRIPASIMPGPKSTENGREKNLGPRFFLRLKPKSENAFSASHPGRHPGHE